MRASCNADLQSSSELPNLSHWLFMFLSLACSSWDSLVSVCTNSLLHRLMDRTIGLRLSYAFCRSCRRQRYFVVFQSNTQHQYIIFIKSALTQNLFDFILKHHAGNNECWGFSLGGYSSNFLTIFLWIFAWTKLKLWKRTVTKKLKYSDKSEIKSKLYHLEFCDALLYRLDVRAEVKSLLLL